MIEITQQVTVLLTNKSQDEEFRRLLDSHGFTWNGGMSLATKSCWSKQYDRQLHHVYPNKKVTYGKGFPDAVYSPLSFSEFKNKYFNDKQ